MRKAKPISTGELPVADIDDSVRLRPVSEAAVETLIASIEATGIMKDEVTVRRVAHQGNRLVLIAGGHRMEAARRLGWATIPAKLYDCSDDWAEMVEIDDNLAHAELSALELVTFTARSKAIYERLHPETAHGGNRGNQHTGGRQAEMISFCQMVAEKRGISERHVSNFARIGERLLPATIEALRGRQLTFKDLDTLSRAETSEQAAVVKRFIGKTPNMKAAIAEVRGHTPPPTDKVEKAHRDLLDKFKRAPKAAQRRFLEELCAAPGFALMISDAMRQAEAQD